MSENEINVQLTFTASPGTWMALGAAGLMLVAGVLAAVSLSVAWMSTTEDGDRIDYALSEIREGGSSLSYDDLDRFAQGNIDGIGMVTTAKVLAIIGTVTAFLAMAVLAVSLFARRFRLTLIGSVIATVTVILLTLAVIFAPLGISSIHDDLMDATETTARLDWAAGLILGIIMTVAAVAAVVLGFLSLRDPHLS